MTNFKTDFKTDLKKEIEKYHDRKKLGGFVDKGTSLVKDHFPMVNGKSREVVMRLNSDVKEDIQVHNINFVPKKLSKLTGEIADQILRDFGQFFTVVAATMMFDKNTNEWGFFEVSYSEDKDFYKPKRKGSSVVRFNQDRLNLMSDEDRKIQFEAKAIRDRAKEVARIAKINALAIKVAETEEAEITKAAEELANK